ncbi:Hypothetical protein NGAL_HAMBI2605_12450 [Neorhizobium galegae bv. orientalis]|nr:Hypothetical protein NGAL_HAMBI2605_12450 [Neorhizobium galegae bv. orientalis]
MIEIRPIRSDEDYEGALRTLSKLWGAASGTLEGDQLDILATLIDAYEKEHFPMDAPSPEALAAFEREQQDAVAASFEDQLVFQVFKDKAGRFAFRLLGAGKMILHSETFDTKSDAINAIKLLQESASQSKIVELAA